MHQSSDQSWLKKSLRGSRGVSHTYTDRFTRAGPVEIKSQLNFPITMVSVSLKVQSFVPFRCLLVVLQGGTDFGSFAYPNSPKPRMVPPSPTPKQISFKNQILKALLWCSNVAVLRFTSRWDPHTTSWVQWQGYREYWILQDVMKSGQLRSAWISHALSV